MKFLVVEDSPTARRLIITALKQMGYNSFEECEDGLQALNLLREKEFDILLTDWNMPNLNGIELATIVRNDEKLKSLPILMLTTRSEKSDILKAVSTKINGYVAKPFTPDSLKQKLDPIVAMVIKRKRELESRQVAEIDTNISKDFLEKFDYVKCGFSIVDKLATIDKMSTEFSDLPTDFSLDYNFSFKSGEIKVVVKVLDSDGKEIDSHFYNYNKEA